MKRKVVSTLLICAMALTMIFARDTRTEAASWKSAYVKALDTKISGGIYSEYAFVKIKGYSKPIMLVLMNESDSYGTSYIAAKFYYNQNGSVKKVGNVKLYQSDDYNYWKLGSKGKKVVLYHKEKNWEDNYVFVKKNGKIKADQYNYGVAGEYNLKYALGTVYYEKNHKKEISKSAYNKAIKISKKIELEEHFAGKASGYDDTGWKY